MTAFKNKTIFGLAVRNQLNELVNDPNTALENLNLRPADFRRLRNIGGSSGISDTFQKISSLKENILLKLDSLQSETSQYTKVINTLFTTNRRFATLDGNLVVNGKFIGKNITQLVFDEDAVPPKFNTIPITTSTNSVWDLQDANTIKLGQPLKIASTSGSPGLAKITMGKIKNVKAFQPRRFSTEVPTHKLQVTVNGTSYYMYAIKNNPFKIEGDFESITGDDVEITSSDTVNYAMGDGTGVIGPAKTQSNIDELEDGTELFVYTNPSNVTNFLITGHDVESLPQGVKWDRNDGQQNKVNLSNNKITTLPDFAKQFPNFKEIIFTQPDNLSSYADRRANYSFAELQEKIPSGVTKLDLTRSHSDFQPETSASPTEPAPFNEPPFENLTSLKLEEMGIGAFETTQATPAIPTGLTELKLLNNYFTLLHPETLIPIGTSAPGPLTSINFGRNDILRTTDIADDASPLEDHVFYQNGTYSSDLEYFNIRETQLGIPNLANKANLEHFEAVTVKYDKRKGDNNSPTGGMYTDVRFQLVNADDTSKFDGCTALTEILLNNSDIFGPIPSFATNTSLTKLEMSNVGVVNLETDNSPMAHALVDAGLPATLKTFIYDYRTQQDLTDASPTENNILPENAFSVADTNSITGFSEIELVNLTYRSKNITIGKFPAVNVVNLDIQANAFTDIQQFSSDNADRLVEIQAQDNNFSIPFNLNNLCDGTEYSVLESVTFRNNNFTEFVENSLPDNKFTALTTLNLENAFKTSADSPGDRLPLPQFLNKHLQTINVSKNAFTKIENDIFKDCDDLTNFSIDETDKENIKKMILSIEELHPLGTTSPVRSFSFSTDTSNRLDITISNPTTKRTYTTTEREDFDLNERIKKLNARNVDISGIKGITTYKELPGGPTGLGLSRTSETRVVFTFDFIQNADRVIIKRLNLNSPNEEFIGNDISTFDIAVFNQTGTGQQEFVDTAATADTLGYEVYGENTRSIIDNVITSNSITLPINSDSPPYPHTA